jgi:hypothetical protein
VVKLDSKSVSIAKVAMGIISKGSVSNITKDVTQCLNSICRQYIKMPTDRAELRNVMHGFHDIANFPNVVGVELDKIKASCVPPGHMATMFRNRILASQTPMTLIE